MTQPTTPFQRRSQWADSWMILAEQYKRLFETMDGETFLQSIAHNRSVVDCFSCIYATLLRNGQVEPLESLDEAQRRELWLEAKRLYGVADQTITDSHFKTYLQEVARAIHTFGSYLMLSQ